MGQDVVDSTRMRVAAHRQPSRTACGNRSPFTPAFFFTMLSKKSRGIFYSFFLSGTTKDVYFLTVFFPIFFYDIPACFVLSRSFVVLLIIPVFSFLFILLLSCS